MPNQRPPQATQATRATGEEWFVALPKPAGEVRDAPHFRSTWLTASQRVLRERGYAAAYEAAIDPALRDQVLGVVPGVWLPMEVAMAHYRAADTLAIPESELVELGFAAMKRANATTLEMISRLARGVGVTPWTVLAQTPRLWSATCDGGAFGVVRLGPKDARLEIHGFPLAPIAYNRISMRGILTAVVAMCSRKVYMKEIPALCTKRSLGFRASWV